MKVTKNSLDEFFNLKPTSKIDYKAELNEEQSEAVTNTEGPCLVIASAGSGKTRVLTYRLMYLIEHNVPPEQILLLTFTNKAASEMISRATNLLNDNTMKINGGTYHSFCANVLRKYCKRIGFKNDFLIKDSVDAADTMNYIKEENGYSKEKNFPRGSELIAIFSTAVNKNKTIEWVIKNKYPKYEDYLQDIISLKEKYTEYKKEGNIFDYDDLLIYTNKLLRDNPDICSSLSNTYKYIMVDEYQDSNSLQSELICLLRQYDNKNICVVGDDQQCIVKGTRISTKNGYKKVEDLTLDDEIFVSSGNGETTYTKPSEIMSKHFIGDIYKITTQSGKVIEVTGDHTLFAYKKKFKPSTVDTADFYMFDFLEEEQETYTHKLWISDKNLMKELDSDNDCENCTDILDRLFNLLKKNKYSYLSFNQYAKLLKECYHFFIPAKKLEVGMFLCTNSKEHNKLINDKIVSIEVKPYCGLVYDINVEFYMNYYSNDICVHNCIYGFRGSNHKNILNFQKQFENCKMIILNKNYRSNQEILDFSNAVSLEAKERFDKTLVGTHSSGYKPEIVYVNDEMTEAEAILYDIIKRHDEGTSYRDMAVLIRSANDSTLLEALIMKASARFNIPFKKFGGIKFMERAFVKDIFAFLKVLVNINDEISWFRIFQMYINIGPAYAKKLANEIKQVGIEALLNEKHKNRKYGECLPLIYNLYVDLKKKDFSEQIDDIINVHYYGARKLTIDNMKSVQSVIREKKYELDEEINDAQVLLEMAKSYKTASDFLNDITLDASAVSEDENGDYLTISTVHSAKGLEFDTVYIINCVEKKFPWVKNPACDTQEAYEEAEEEMEEERRVFYVAITRAKEHLLMYVPEYISSYGRAEEAIISRFLKNNTSLCQNILIEN